MVNEAKYKKWLLLDTGLIIGMWVFLVLSESYITYMILSEITSRGMEIPIYLMGGYVFFLLFMFVVEGLGCLNVWRSIKTHMYEFEYYD